MSKEDNKVIAEFMGLTPCFDNGLSGPLQVGFYMLTKNNIPYCVEYSKLQYHTSWDWLMPVVEKIQSVQGYNKDSYLYFKANGVLDLKICSPIIDAYTMCIQFITWYNQQPK